MPIGLSQPAPISREDVRRLCGDTIYARGRAYLSSGLIHSASVKGDLLFGEVQGTRAQPYLVSVRLAKDDVDPLCDCPHDEPFCKHVAALLLAWIEQPRTFVTVISEAEYEAQQSAVAEVGDSQDSVPLGGAVTFDGEAARMRLAEGLSHHVFEDLKTVARRLNIPIGGKTKEVVVLELARAMSDPEQIRTRLLSLGKGERLVLDIVHLAGGAHGLSLDRLKQRLKSFGQLTLAANAADVVENLSGQGLLVSNDGGLGSQYSPTKVLDAAASEISVFSVSYLLNPRRYRGSEIGVLAQVKPLEEDLHLVWTHLAKNQVDVRLLPEKSIFERQHDALSGWNNSPNEIFEVERYPRQLNTFGFSLAVLPAHPSLPDTHLRLLSDTVTGGQEEVVFLYHLLKKLGLVEEKGRITVSEGKMQEFLRLSRVERLKALVRAWLKPDRWHEMFLLGSCPEKLQVRRLVGSSYLKHRDFFGEIAEAQRFIAHAIARLEGERWYSCADLLPALQALHPDFLTVPLASVGNRPAWFFQSKDTGKQLDPYSLTDWLQAEGHLVLSVLRGPLRWLGFVEVAQVGGKLEAFRTTSLAPLLIGRSVEPLASEDTSTPQVGSDLSVSIASGSADPEAHSFLGRLGVLEEATPSHFRYRLTAGRVALAFEQGLTASEITGFLERRGASLSPEFVKAIEGWWSSYGQIRLYENLTVVEFADDYVLRELRATTSISQHIIHEFSPRLVVVSPESVEKLVAEMTRKGHTPKVAEGEV